MWISVPTQPGSPTPPLLEVKPGTIAVNWEERCILIRSYRENYWYDSRYPNIGMILNQDEHVVRTCEIIRTKWSPWSL